jgi:hypothetical protein
MAIPIAIFVVCLSGGVYASSRWLPSLAAGPVGGFAFFAVCGLLGSGLAIAGLRIYTTVDALSVRGGLGLLNREIVAEGLTDMLWEAGTVLGLAAAVYLLAPPAELAEEHAAGPTF